MLLGVIVFLAYEAVLIAIAVVYIPDIATARAIAKLSPGARCPTSVGGGEGGRNRVKMWNLRTYDKVTLRLFRVGRSY